MLDWAINESGFSDAELAHSTGVNVEALQAWKAGSARPRLTQLRKLAGKLHRPQALFLLAAPPATDPIPVQFRSPRADRHRDLNPIERRYLRRATRFQEVLAWLLTELEVDTPSLPAVSITEDSAASARQMRTLLRVSTEEQQAWRTPSIAFDHWREAAERLGVSVLLFSMGKESVQGFSISHRQAPLIAINTTWREEARIFTLVHELGHLLTGTSSACLGGRIRPADPVERWCDQFAGDVLAPREALVTVVRRLAGPVTHVNTLEVPSGVARRFKISLRAAVIAMIHAGLATWDLYQEIPQASDAKPKMGGGTGRSRREIREDEFGRRTAGLFVTAVNRDVLSRSQALDYLDIPDLEFDRIPPLAVSDMSR